MNRKLRERMMENPSRTLDLIADFLADTSEMTTEEIKEDLRFHGIDPDECVEKVYEILRKHGIHPKGAMHWRNSRIRELRQEGWTLENIGIHFEISKQRVGQILGGNHGR